MQTAAGLRFLRTLTRLGDAIPSYLDVPNHPRTESTRPDASVTKRPHTRPVAPPRAPS